MSAREIDKSCQRLGCETSLWALYSFTFAVTTSIIANLNADSMLLLYHYRTRRMSLRVMTMPAADKPNHVMAYPTCTAGVTLNSLSLSAVGTKGKALECES